MSKLLSGTVSGRFWASFPGCHSLVIGLPIRGYPDDATGFDRSERGVGLVHERREILVSVAPRAQQHYRELEAGDVLLVRDALVRAQEQT